MMNNFNRIELEQVRERDLRYKPLPPPAFLSDSPSISDYANAQVSPRGFNFGAPLRLVGGVCRGGQGLEGQGVERLSE